MTSVHYDLGIVLEALGKVKQASSAYRTSQKLDPGNADAYKNLDVLLTKSGVFKGAYEQFARALEVDSDNGEAARNL